MKYNLHSITFDREQPNKVVVTYYCFKCGILNVREEKFRYSMLDMCRICNDCRNGKQPNCNCSGCMLVPQS
jgi:hypothetical protein